MAEYVGFDVSKEETAFCVRNAAGTILVPVLIVGDLALAGLVIWNRLA